MTAIGVNQVIGAAIFLLPADVARLVGSWGPVMFAAIGLTSLLVALCFAEVGSRFESTGGPIGPARVAFGRFVGFEVGSDAWFSRVSSGASVINGLALALAFYWPSLASGVPRALVILGVIGGLTWANLRGIKQASWLVNAFTIGKVLPLAIFVLVGVWFADFSRAVPAEPLPLATFGTAALLLIFAYGGYEVTGVPAGEAVNPRRDVPFAFVATILHRHRGAMTLTATVAAGVLPDVGASRTPIADASAVLMGVAGGLLVSVGSVISTTGNNMGQLLSGSRSVFALAEHGDLPAVFARVHPIYRTPYIGDLVHDPGPGDAGLVGLVRLPGGGQRRGPAGDLPVHVHGDPLAAAAVSGRQGGTGHLHRAAGPRDSGRSIAHQLEHPGRGHHPATVVRCGRARGRGRALRSGHYGHAAPGGMIRVDAVHRWPRIPAVESVVSALCARSARARRPRPPADRRRRPAWRR